MDNAYHIVTVIVPTTHERAEFNERIKAIFFQQTHPNKELLFDYSDGTIGAKRNALCERAIGDIIVSMDSDDLFKSDWITKSVDALLKSEADIVGLSQYFHYNTADGSWYLYSYPPSMNNWLAGGTFAFWKNYWRGNKFKDTNIGEDGIFLLGATTSPKIYAHKYIEGFVAIVHAGNTSKKMLNNPVYRRCSEEEERVLFDRWKEFITPPANTI